MKLGKLFVAVEFGKFIKMKLGGAELVVGEDVDAGELGFELTEGADRDNTFFGTGIIVSVVFDAETAMDAVGDSEGIKKDRVSGDFGKVFGRIKKEEVVIVGLLEFHNFGFDTTLTTAEGLAHDACGAFAFGRWWSGDDLFEFGFELM